jgi:hypothetical protein
MATFVEHDIFVRIDTIDQLFSAPEVNPFSDKEASVLGEAALLLAVRQLLASRRRNWQETRLVIELPADQITADLQTRVVEAVRRYGLAKTEDNRLTIRLSRIRSLIGLAMATGISAAVIVAAFVLSRTVLANASEFARAVIAAGVGVFVWVVLWDPMEALLFGWASPHLENRILRRLAQVPIVIKPQP